MNFFNTSFVKNIVVYLLTILEGFLILRVLLKTLAANSDSGFVQWVYDITQPLVEPFAGMFPNSISGISVQIEFSTIFGMIMYALVGYALIALVDMIESR